MTVHHQCIVVRQSPELDFSLRTSPSNRPWRGVVLEQEANCPRDYVVYRDNVNLLTEQALLTIARNTNVRSARHPLIPILVMMAGLLIR